MKPLMILILLAIIISPIGAIANDCELLAKNYQRAHGGDLMFIQPLKSNGAYDLGDYNGHWLNKAYNKTIGIYYYDSQTNNYFISESEVLDWYTWNTGKDAEIFNYNKGGVPFPLKHYY